MRPFVPLAVLALTLAGCPAPPRLPKGAVLLYDVDFSAPEQAVGREVHVVEAGTQQKFPSRLPSQVFFGHPVVVAKLCGLAKQPLQLAVATGEHGYEGVEFLLDQRYGRYHVELDVCVDHLGPPPLPAQAVQLAVFLDIPDAYALGFLSGGEIGVIDPNLAPETATAPRPVGRFEPGKPVHVAFDVDLEKQHWRISLDGKSVYDGALQASIPRAVRVVLRGNQVNVAAVDDVLVWAEHDLSQPDAAPPPPVTGPER
jgi:hypothetical protein